MSRFLLTALVLTAVAGPPAAAAPPMAGMAEIPAACSRARRVTGLSRARGFMTCRAVRPPPRQILRGAAGPPDSDRAV